MLPKRKKILFDGTNYKLWSQETKTVLMTKGLWKIVTDGPGPTLHLMEGETVGEFQRRVVRLGNHDYD